jgi:hypothetical protein
VIPVGRSLRPDADPLADFPTLHVESWPAGFSSRREESDGHSGC